LNFFRSSAISHLDFWT